MKKNNENNLKNEYDLKNQGNLKNEDDLKNEGDLNKHEITWLWGDRDWDLKVWRKFW